MITNIEDYFTKGCGRCARFDTPDCSIHRWQSGLDALRCICLSEGLSETVKWGHPCYMYAGRNIALIGALRGDYRLSFMNADLLNDPNGFLEKSGPNSQIPSMLTFGSNDEVEAKETIIRTFLREAVAHTAAGSKSKRVVREIELPEELIRALDEDPELSEAFYNLSPGRQKSYAFNLSAAKASATRFARIAKFRDHILAGKGALER